MRIASLVAVAFFVVGCNSSERAAPAQPTAEPDRCESVQLASLQEQVRPLVFCSQTSDCDAYCGGRNAGRCNNHQCICL